MSTKTTQRPATMLPDNPFSTWLQSAPEQFKQTEVVAVPIELPADDWLVLQVEAAECGETIGQLLSRVVPGIVQAYREARHTERRKAA